MMILLLNFCRFERDQVMSNLSAQLDFTVNISYSFLDFSGTGVFPFALATIHCALTIIFY